MAKQLPERVSVPYNVVHELMKRVWIVYWDAPVLRPHTEPIREAIQEIFEAYRIEKSYVTRLEDQVKSLEAEIAFRDRQDEIAGVINEILSSPEKTDGTETTKPVDERTDSLGFGKGR